MNNSLRLVECVPNFSEGRDMEIIKQITDSIEKHKGVKLLDVDPGEATNRTVVTFVGTPKAICDAAFDAVKKAGELIDMRNHHGAHPRMGATDVLPLIPVAGITLEECAELARGLARRIADELLIPCYCYEAAALKEEHRNLAVCRAGEYEGLPEKLANPDKAPDMGARAFDERIAHTGCTVVGARAYYFLYLILRALPSLHLRHLHLYYCLLRLLGNSLLILFPWDDFLYLRAFFLAFNYVFYFFGIFIYYLFLI